MKKICDNSLVRAVAILYLLTLTSLNMNAQRRYHPFVQEGKTWNYMSKTGELFSCVIKGDTIINTKAYSKLYTKGENGESTYEAALREQDYTVFQVECGSEKEKALFDFDLDSLETIYDEPVFGMSGDGCIRSIIEEVCISGNPCRVITYNPYGISENGERYYTTGLGFWIEGIGGSEGIRQDATLLSVYEGEKCIFDRRNGTLKDYADHTVREERPKDYIPFVATGKKWVHLVLNDNPSYYDIATYTVKEAVLKDGYVWFNIYKESVNQDRIVTKSDNPIYCIREWDGCVYRYEDSASGNCIKVFDMKATAGDQISIYGTQIGYEFITTYLDSIYVSDEKFINNCGRDYRSLVIGSHKNNYRDEWLSHTIIEGIGDYNNFLDIKFYDRGIVGQGSEQILECYLEDELIFQNIKGYIKDIYDIYLGISTAHSKSNGNCSMFHDLQGRRLTQEPQQGVFIRNGRKVVKGK